MDCIFCKIAKGEAPSRKLYEDEEFMVILDIGGAFFINSNEPIPGRMLAIPKRHVVRYHDLEDEEAAKLFVLSKKAASIIKESYKPKFVDLIIRGGRVDHVHIILQPEFGEDDPHNLMFRLMESLFKLLPDEFLDKTYGQLKEKFKGLKI
ncbi:MAG: HIT domain-containing protein [Deferribacterota bacterium]|nr:HIT domain-containing protein [Deferribacterota bacterium]